MGCSVSKDGDQQQEQLIVGTGPVTLLKNNPEYVDYSQDVMHENAWQTGVFPKQLWTCTSITNLDISGNQLGDISKVVNLVNLRVLNISENEIKELPLDMGCKKLPHLTTLLAYTNKLVLLPKKLCTLTSLTEMNLYNNKLKRMPDEINMMTGLETLNLAKNPLTALPPLDKLTLLRELKCHMCEIETIAGSWETLTSLEEILFNTNKLSTIPKMPPNVKVIDVVGNLITHVDPTALDLCVALTEFKANNNQLTEIPLCVLRPTMESMGFASNDDINVIPREIEQCQALLTLVLNGNALVHLPQELLSLTLLVRCNLLKNSIERSDPVTKKVFDGLKKQCTSGKGYFKADEM